MTPLDATVVIPTRNRPAATLAAVQSALQQIPPPRQVVVVDDASTDDTCARLQAQFSDRIHLILNPRRMGANAARNRGGEICRTRFLAFLDSDDRFLPGKLALQIEALEETGTGFSCTGFVTESGRRYSLPTYSDRLLLIRNCLGGTSSLVMRSSLFERERFNPEMLAVQDWELYLRLVRHTQPVVLAAPLYLYGLSEGVRITKDPRKRALGHFKLYKDHIRDHPETTSNIRRYHRMVQRTLTRKNDSISRAFFNKVLLRVTTALT